MSERLTQNILITGASSGIARALAELLARDGHHLVLAARDIVDLQNTAADLRLRFGGKVDAVAFDALDFASHAAMYESCGPLDAVIACHGLLIDQAEAEADPEKACMMIDVNYSSVVNILERAAAKGVKQIAAISSVAGDRGRKSNYLYGAPKAALSTYLDGLRHRLARTGVSVLTIKPGFVDTKMTWGKPGMFLVATPGKVARDIHRALKRRRSGVLYTPWFWRWIMLIIRSIPEPIFKRLNI
jgi:short-subunit dehydrogenase